MRGFFYSIAIVACFGISATWIARATPVTQHIVRNVHIVRHNPPREVIRNMTKIVFRIPGKETAAVDAKAACRGDFPVQVVSSVLQGDAPNQLTWATVHSVGSEVNIYCHKNGDYSKDWTTGTIVQLPQGEQD